MISLWFEKELYISSAALSQLIEQHINISELKFTKS